MFTASRNTFRSKLQYVISGFHSKWVIGVYLLNDNWLQINWPQLCRLLADGELKEPGSRYRSTKISSLKVLWITNIICLHKLYIGVTSVSCVWGGGNILWLTQPHHFCHYPNVASATRASGCILEQYLSGTRRQDLSLIEVISCG